MNRYQIQTALEDLAMSSGTYQRLLDRLEEMSEEDRDAYYDRLEELCFVDVVDLILYLEG